MRVLILCNQGQNRSRTAAALLVCPTRARGIFARAPTDADMRWANAIIVMEEHQRAWLAERFPKEYLRLRIVCLDIPDIYRFGQPELVTALRTRLAAAMPGARLQPVLAM